MAAHRCELRRLGDGRWDVLFRGERIVVASRDPEPQACCALLARGVRGHVVLHHRNGTISFGADVAAGAAKAAKSENAARPKRPDGAQQLRTLGEPTRWPT